MWGKRPKPGGKGLRCKVFMVGRREYCDRPARLYSREKNGLDCGNATLCINHVRLHEREGIAVKLIDRRKRTVTN
jgi:hypothetical protein